MFRVSIEDGGLLTRLTGMALRAENLAPIFKSIGDEIVAPSIKQNFIDEGRPSQWQPSRSAIEDGRRTLWKTGRLAQSAKTSSYGENFVEVTTGAGLGAYPIFLSRGTNSQIVSPKQRGFFWAKFYETGRTFWRAMALSKTLKGLPTRRFSLVQDADVVAIQNKLKDYLIRGAV
jgi:phage gpG-like protein